MSNGPTDPSTDVPVVADSKGSIFDQEVAELGKLIDVHEGISAYLRDTSPNRAERRKRDRALRKRDKRG